MSKHTVSVHFVAAAVANLGPQVRERMLKALGIPPELLNQSRARVPAQAFSGLWLAVARELDDEFFGLDRRRMKVGSFALLCHAVLAADTLDQALRRMLRGFAVLLDDVAGTLSVDRGEACISLSNRIAAPESRRFADETFLVMVHGLLCWLAGRRIPLKAATFAYPKPAHAAEYADMYSAQLRFEAPLTSICFDASWLSKPVAQNAGALKVFLETAPQSVFVKYQNQDGWAARIRRRLRRCVGEPGWPVLEDLAQEFRVTPSTLRRRLDAEGTRFQDIKNQLRLELALHFLSTTNLSVADIADQLGFQDTSVFHRGFKRWSGMRPGEYRARQALSPMDNHSSTGTAHQGGS
jgi:AraC-like DNA-binding protein